MVLFPLTGSGDWERTIPGLEPSLSGKGDVSIYVCKRPSCRKGSAHSECRQKAGFSSSCGKNLSYCTLPTKGAGCPGGSELVVDKQRVG